MKRNSTILLMLLCFLGDLKSQFVDDFSDGNFTVNPTWIGDDSLFIVNSNNELQLADSNYSKSTTYLSTPSKAISNAVWEFKFKCDFPPSTSNFAEVHLVSDNPDVTGNNSGYYVQIGSETGTADQVTLFKSTNGSRSAIISGRPSTVGTNPSGWIKVTRDSIGNWELFLDTSAAKTGYISEGTVLNTDFISGEYFGIQCKYTTGRKLLFYFDSITVTGSFYTDTLKPIISNLSVISSNALEVSFSENIDPITGLLTANYSANNSIGSPSGAQYKGTDSTIIALTFSTAFTSGTNYNLSVNNIEDANGNILNPASKNFQYVKLDTAQKGDMQINEIMADPNPPVLLPANMDWVELYNSSSKSFSLKGWTFWDKTSTTRDTLPDKILLPGEYVVLCDAADSAALSGFGGRVIPMQSFPALNIDDELITLKNQFGIVIDEINYFKSWYSDENKEEGGYTLEKINPNHPCSNSANWKASNDSKGGTPGFRNSVYNTTPEFDRPILLSATIQNLNTIELLFSKKLDSLSLVNSTITGVDVAQIQAAEAQSESAVLLLSNPLEEGVVYNLSIKGAADCFGNLILEDAITFGKGKTPITHQVVINEIFPIPDVELNPLFDAEFVELYNNTTSLIGLDSCFFSDLSSNASLNGAIIEPNEYLIVCEKSAVENLSKYGNVIGVSSWPSLNNSGDVLSLTCKNQSVHTVEYNDDWYQIEDKKDGGWSLEQVDAANPCGENLNWKGSLDANKATPGKDNSILGVLKDAVAPEIVAANAINDTTLLIEFNENISLSDFNSASFKVSPSVVIEFDSLQGKKTTVLRLNAPLAKRTIYTLTIDGISDCVGNSVINQSVTFGLPEYGVTGDLVINEVLFDPYSTASTDFVEIYNRSEKIIDLQGWFIADFDENKDSLDGFQLISNEPRSLLPNAFAVISKSNSDLIKHYTTIDEKTFIEITSMPSYPNGEGSVVLLNDSGLVVDRFNYSVDYQHIIIKNPEGISLERLDYERPSNDETNWHSAAESVGFATPGLENSQFKTSSDFSKDIVLEPQTFSPDNDGFNDVLNINYAFDAPGNVANIEIMDTDGRPIKILSQNELLAISGTISWDGSSDNNLKARAGMYIVHFEIFNEKGENQRFKKVCALAVNF